MSHSESAAEVINPGRLGSSLLSVNMVNVTKLSSINYITWSAQVKSLLRGYDLLCFIDSTAEIPPPTTNDSGSDEPNPAFALWQRQDSLVFSALMGSIELAHQPLIASATTSLEAWNTLTQTYAKPSRGHIKQLKNQLKQSVKGTATIDAYMQSIKAKADALALLGSPTDPEDLTDLVLAGLGDDYTSLIESVHSRDSPISFSELHEKLINRELSLSMTTAVSSTFPITANHAQQRTQNWRPNNNNTNTNNKQQYGNRNQGNDQRSSRPYLGRCQACGTQGHSVKRCPQFRIVSQSNAHMNAFQGHPRGYSPAYPQAYNAMMPQSGNTAWLMDSGASHHLTSDLANLSLHSPYTGGEDVQIGNGMGLQIANTGSLSL